MKVEIKTEFESKLAQIQQRVAARHQASPHKQAWDILNPRLISTNDDALFCEAMRLGEEWRQQANHEGK